jgi:uncharacterized protein YigA (DUF484 family)
MFSSFSRSVIWGRGLFVLLRAEAFQREDREQQAREERREAKGERCKVRGAKREMKGTLREKPQRGAVGSPFMKSITGAALMSLVRFTSRDSVGAAAAAAVLAWG